MRTEIQKLLDRAHSDSLVLPTGAECFRVVWVNPTATGSRNPCPPVRDLSVARQIARLAVMYRYCERVTITDSQGVEHAP